jgi:tyrosine-specific transport protein
MFFFFLVVFVLLARSSSGGAFISPPTLSKSRSISTRTTNSLPTAGMGHDEPHSTVDEENLRSRLAFPELADGRVDRLFSNIGYSKEMDKFGEDEECLLPNQFKHNPTDVMSSIALIGGTAVGAGILALPAKTIEPGLVPSTLLLLALWAIMASTGLLIAEVNINCICRQGDPGLGLLSLTRASLGNGGAAAAGLVYAFLHYALLTAYIAQGGGLISGFIAADGDSLVGPALFASVIGGGMAFSSDENISRANNILVAIILASFAVLSGLGVSSIHLENLQRANWSALPEGIPIMLVALVFHNVVPVVVTQLEGDRERIRMAILYGSAIPLAMFLLWNVVILGSIDEATFSADLHAGVFDPVQALIVAAGKGGSDSLMIGYIIAVFSLAAITTSFIGFVLGLLDFFTDAFGMSPGSEVAPLYALTLFPPLAVACTNPDVFFQALDVAGTWGISSLFVLLPPVLAWRQRYIDKEPLATLPLLPGGRASLLALGGFAVAVILLG